METKEKLIDEILPDRSSSVDDLQLLCEEAKKPEKDIGVPSDRDSPVNLIPMKLDNEINPDRNSDDDKETPIVSS